MASPPRPSLVSLRQRLHRLAEPSNEERQTAELLEAELAATGPDEVVRELGGHGIAAVYLGSEPGPTVLLRSDMDALPIAEGDALAYASQDPSTSHKCGHDGHMAMLVGVARGLALQRPGRGRVVLLFQPAEETGEGAARVLADPRFAPLAPDRVLALHNLPGRPLGQVVLREQSFASASTGMIVELTGVSSHAAEPHAGTSPVAAAASLALAIQAAPQNAVALDECVQATVVGLEVGGPAFGTSPGDGRVLATLRAHTEEGMGRLTEYCERQAQGLAAAHGLGCSVSWTDAFPATRNDPRVVRVVRDAARREGLEVAWAEAPLAWSEDFGHFTARAPGALFGLGSGVDQLPLHNSGYDFPPELLDVGPRLFLACLPGLLADDLGEGKTSGLQA